MNNRYIFFKRLYNKYIIVFIKNNKYYSMGIDKLMLKYLINSDVNYITIDNKNVVLKYDKDNNKYNEYLMKEYFKLMLFKLQK